MGETQNLGTSDDVERRIIVACCSFPRLTYAW